MSVEYYKRQIIDIRSSILREKESKKRDNASMAAHIKSASSADNKAYLRKERIAKAASHDATIERLKSKLEDAKEDLAEARRHK